MSAGLPSACAFCGEPIEPLDPERPPARERVAYDPGLGRLWVVCPACDRWNAVPLELRWEALEGLERMARDEGRSRLETANLMLLRVRGGELVRVGAAPRPEFAGWRYGRRLGRRRPATLRAWIAEFLSELPEAPPGGYDLHGMPRPHLGGWVGSPFIERAAALTAIFLHVPLAPTCPSCGGPLLLSPLGFQELRFSPGPGGAGLVARCGLCRAMVTPTVREARAAVRLGLSAVDRRRVSTTVAEEAGSRISRAGGAVDYLEELARAEAALGELAAAGRLALAVALDEQAEAEALEVEWRRAEEVASIVEEELTFVPGFDEFRRRVLAGDHTG